MELAYAVHMKESTSPARSRRPRGSLTPERILEAAEELAADGLDALTVRAVAARMQASPMAFYRHFDTKDALVDALLDRVLGRFRPPGETDDWVDDLGAFAVNHRRVLQDHPWAITALFGHPSPGLNAVRIGECALAILQRGRVTGDRAVAVFSGVIALNYGWSAFASARDAVRTPGEYDEPPPLGSVLATLPVAEFPLTVAVAADLGDFGADAHYRIALGQLLAGLRATGGAARARRG
jgi:AcrR family transcriptional regulator